jgi:hypothetical protein
LTAIEKAELEKAVVDEEEEEDISISEVQPAAH